MDTLGLGLTRAVAVSEHPSPPGGEVTVAVSVFVWVPTGSVTVRVQLKTASSPTVKVHCAACVLQLPSPLAGKQMKKSSAGSPGVPLSSLRVAVTGIPPATFLTVWV